MSTQAEDLAFLIKTGQIKDAPKPTQLRKMRNNNGHISK
jgi:hypothetical protein